LYGPRRTHCQPPQTITAIPGKPPTHCSACLKAQPASRLAQLPKLASAWYSLLLATVTTSSASSYTTQARHYASLTRERCSTGDLVCPYCLLRLKLSRSTVLITLAMEGNNADLARNQRPRRNRLKAAGHHEERRQALWHDRLPRRCLLLGSMYQTGG
jgi:hypothetical protein